MIGHILDFCNISVYSLECQYLYGPNTGFQEHNLVRGSAFNSYLPPLKHLFNFLNIILCIKRDGATPYFYSIKQYLSYHGLNNICFTSHPQESLWLHWFSKRQYDFQPAWSLESKHALHLFVMGTSIPRYQKYLNQLYMFTSICE